MQIHVSKAYFWTVLLKDADQIIAFNDWLNYTSLIYDDKPNRAAKIAWGDSPEIDLTLPFVQELIPALVPAVLKQEVLDRINAEIASRGGTAIDTTRTKIYDISRIAGDLRVWIAENIQPIGTAFTLSGDKVVTVGTLPLPEVQ